MKQSKINTPKLRLDSEEAAILNSYEKGEWQSTKNLNHEKSKAKKIASDYLRKDKRINIRISTSDLMRIKQMAAHEGLPYQTLIASILHKYSSGNL